MGEAELRKAELGKLALYFWWNLGKPKTPEEVLRSDIVRAVIDKKGKRVTAKFGFHGKRPFLF